MKVHVVISEYEEDHEVLGVFDTYDKAIGFCHSRFCLGEHATHDYMYWRDEDDNWITVESHEVQ